MGLGLRTRESIRPTGGCPSAVRTLRTRVSFSGTSKLLSTQTRPDCSPVIHRPEEKMAQQAFLLCGGR